MTYEAYMKVKATDGKISRSIHKAIDSDGKRTNDTNFSKGCWEKESDNHILGVWRLDDGRLQSIRDDAEKAQKSILSQKERGKCKASSHTTKGRKRARSADNTACVVSDSDF
jgi:hypothetical protein